MSDNTPEPSLDPPDEPTYCRTPDCDQCKLPYIECPGTEDDPGSLYHYFVSNPDWPELAS